MLQRVLNSLIQKKNMTFDEYTSTCNNFKKIGQGKKAEVYLCDDRVIKSVGKGSLKIITKNANDRRDQFNICPRIIKYANMSETANEILIHHVLGNKYPRNCARLVAPAVLLNDGKILININTASEGDLVNFLLKFDVERRSRIAEKMLKRIAIVLKKLIINFSFLHGDLKAKNVLVHKFQDGYEPIIADFGESSITYKNTRLLDRFAFFKSFLSKTETKIGDIGIENNKNFVFFKTKNRLLAMLRKQTRGHATNPARFIEFCVLFFSVCLVQGCESLFVDHFRYLCGYSKYFEKIENKLLRAQKKNPYSVTTAIDLAASLPLRREFVDYFSKI